MFLIKNYQSKMASIKIVELKNLIEHNDKSWKYQMNVVCLEILIL